VGRPGTYRSRAGHHSAPEMRLRKGDSCVGHGLFVVRPIGWQSVPILIKGFANAGNIAVAEDSEHSAKKRNELVALRPLNPCAHTGEVAHQGLCSRQSDGAALGNARILWDGHYLIHAPA